MAHVFLHSPSILLHALEAIVHNAASHREPVQASMYGPVEGSLSQTGVCLR